MSFAPEPGPEHAWFRRHAGTWDADITATFYPGAPPVRWKGEATLAPGCGGLWEIMEFRGDMGGRPFAGHGVTGFDAQQQKYVQCWVDSMSSSLLLLTGTLNEATKTLVMEGEMTTPMGPSRVRQTTRETGSDAMEFTIEAPTHDAGWFELMRVRYARRAGA